jgi:hypothetical protein
MAEERINEVSQNLNPLDFWGCLGWKTVAPQDKWVDVYGDNYYYLLITTFYKTPVKARFCDDVGGQFIICTAYRHETAESTYFSWDADKILYVADVPSTDDVLKSINSICEKVDYWQSKYDPLLGLGKEE